MGDKQGVTCKKKQNKEGILTGRTKGKMRKIEGREGAGV
jgi:hypothetical protein